MPSDDDDAGTGADEPKTTKAKVTWRGIVDVPVDAPPSRKEKVMAQIGSSGVPRPELTRRRKRVLLAGTLVIVVVALVLLSAHITAAGSVSVPVTFGSAGTPLPEGLHFTAPWPITNTNDMSIQTQNYTMTAADIPGTDDPVLVLGLDGGSATVQATLLYALDPDRASDVFREIGPDFGTVLVQPTARNCIRTQFSNVDIVQAATGSLDDVQQSVRQCIAEKIEPRGISLQDLQLREVSLGDDVQGAVNARLTAQQQAEQQIFELEKANRQAEIARVQASGTADAQQILACGGTVQTKEQDGQPTQVIVPNSQENCNPANLSPEVLEYNYIQMLKQVLSSGSNTIILGNSAGSGVNPVINVGPSTTTPSP